MEARTRRYAEISAIGVEHDLPRSYTTVEECKALAKAVFAGARMIRTQKLAGTTAPDAVTRLGPSEGVFSIGGEASIIDGVGEEIPAAAETSDVDLGSDDNAPPHDTQNLEVDSPPVPKSLKPRAPKAQSMKFARPNNLKELK